MILSLGDPNDAMNFLTPQPTIRFMTMIAVIEFKAVVLVLYDQGRNIGLCDDEVHQVLNVVFKALSTHAPSYGLLRSTTACKER